MRFAEYSTCGARSLFSRKGGVMVKRSRRSLTRLATLLIGVLGGLALASGLVFGQEFSATMSGVVHDANGGVVAGGGVTAEHLQLGAVRSVMTHDTGSADARSGFRVGSGGRIELLWCKE